MTTSDAGEASAAMATLLVYVVPYTEEKIGRKIAHRMGPDPPEPKLQFYA